MSPHPEDTPSKTNTQTGVLDLIQSVSKTLVEAREAVSVKYKTWVAAQSTERPAVANLMRNLTLSSVLKIANDIGPKLPHKNDPLSHKVIKLLGVLASFDERLSAKSQGRLWQFFETSGVCTSRNAQFVQVVTQSSVLDQFQVRYFPMNDYCEIVIAHHAEWGTLYLVQYRYGGVPRYDDEFWHTKGFLFDKTLEALWASSHQQLCVQLNEPDEYGQRTPEFTSAPTLTDPLLGKGPEMLERLVSEYKTYQAKGHGRTNLFVGPPGTGKSTMAQHLCQQLGGRLLLLQADAMAFITHKSLDFLVKALRPTMIVIDDLDRVPELQSRAPHIFQSLINLKRQHPHMFTMITINDIGKLDAAMLRSGRIETFTEFELLTAEERKAFLTGYLHRFSASYTPEHLQQLADATDKINHADLRELALQLSCTPLPEVLENLTVRRKWIEKAKETRSAKEGPKPDVVQSKAT